MIFIRRINNQCLSGEKASKMISLFSSSKHKVYEIKNNHMLIVQDKQKVLSYMSEVQIEGKKKGIVLKIQQSGTTYIGMYQQILNSMLGQKQITISNSQKSWKSSSIQLSNKIHQHLQQATGIYQINNNLISNCNRPATLQQKPQNHLQILNGNKSRLKSTSPILNICYDLYYGDMISFLGCRGSKKTQTAINISKQFVLNNSNNKSITLYVNSFYKQSKQLSNKNNNSICFTIPENNKPTDTGVYMLTLKAIAVSNQLKRKGMDVLLIIDNLNDIMLREWNLLQSIKFNSKVSDSSKLFQYNTLKIAPISMFNELYSTCQDKSRSKNINTMTKSPVKGSLTSILIAQNQNNELMQQITSYSNNLKHLQTLSKVVQFPLDFKINSNTYYQKPKQQQIQTIKSQPGYYQKQMYRFLRSYTNKYLRQKMDSQLKRQLYKNQMRDAPWDYFFLLDANWWVVGVKEMSNGFKSYKQANNFLRWIIFNIQNDFVNQWNLTSKQSYLKFISYLKNQYNLAESIETENIEFTDEDMSSFIQDGKMQGWVNPFKKDYL